MSTGGVKASSPTTENWRSPSWTPKAPLQPPDGTVGQLRARFPSLVREGRAHLAGFVLHVFVVVDAEAEVEVLEAVERVGQAGFNIDARLIEVNDGQCLALPLVLVPVFVMFVLVLVIVLVVLMFVIVLAVAVLVVPVGMAVAGDAVDGVEVADGDAHEAALADEGEADGTAADIEAAARQMPVRFLVLVPVLVVLVVLVLVLVVLVLVLVFVLVLVLVVVLFLLFEGAHPRGLGVAGDVVVAGLAAEGVEVPCHVAAAAVEPEGRIAAVAVVGAAQVEGAEEALRHFLWDASRLDIDHAADGAGTVEQGR